LSFRVFRCGPRRRIPPATSLAIGLVVACAISARPSQARAQEAATAVYVRTDSDRTVVIAPRLRVQVPIAEPTKLSLIYAVDVWTSASVDIMASASKVPVTEQRDELDVSIDHELEDLTFTAAYRLSTEPDYVSHGGSGGFSYDFADNNSTLALGLSGSGDQVGKAGDPRFSRPVGTFGGRLSFTQVLGTGTLAQAMYELSRTSGFLASPYRWVPIGPGGECTSAVMGQSGLGEVCVPETSPSERLRHALGLEFRQALGEAVAFGVAYRFYTDDWGILSHTLRGELDIGLDADSILGARYRFYTQGAADHYRSRYLEPQLYVTTDKELSPLSSHRVALELDRVWHFAGDHALTSSLSAAAIFYSYTDFTPLDHITAFEVNAALVFAP
jgi:hypothetical protein